MKLKNLGLEKFKSSGNSYSVVPTGEYNCILKLIQEKPSKNGGTGTTLLLMWRVVDGEHAGSSIPSWFNMEEESCREVFAIMLTNMGFDPGKVEDTDELIGGECRLSVELKKGENAPSRNSVKYYLSPEPGEAHKDSGDSPKPGDLAHYPALGAIMV